MKVNRSRIFPNRSKEERIEYCKKNIWNRYGIDSPFYVQSALSLSYLWCEYETFFDVDFFDELNQIFNPLTQIKNAEKLLFKGDISVSEI